MGTEIFIPIWLLGLLILLSMAGVIFIMISLVMRRRDGDFNELNRKHDEKLKELKKAVEQKVCLSVFKHMSTVCRNRRKVLNGGNDPMVESFKCSTPRGGPEKQPACSICVCPIMKKVPEMPEVRYGELIDSYIRWAE